MQMPFEEINSREPFTARRGFVYILTITFDLFLILYNILVMQVKSIGALQPLDLTKEMSNPLLQRIRQPNAPFVRVFVEERCLNKAYNDSQSS